MKAGIAAYLSRERVPKSAGTDREPATVILPVSTARRVEEWCRAQPKIPSRSDAIRQLVDAGLEAAKK